MKGRQKGKKWDGVSRVPDDIYRKNWEDIFGKKQPKEKEKNNDTVK